VHQLGAVGHVGAAVARLDAGGDQQTRREDRGLFGGAVAVGVFEHQDLVVDFLPRLDVRVDLVAGDPQAPLGIEIDVDRLGQQRIGGIEIHLQAFAELERAAFELGVGIGDDLELALGVGRGGAVSKHGGDEQSGRQESVKAGESSHYLEFAHFEST